jgi:hypothetical protein
MRSPSRAAGMRSSFSRKALGAALSPGLPLQLFRRRPRNLAILTTQGMRLPSWNKNWSAMTGSTLAGAYTTRSARNIRIGS